MVKGRGPTIFDSGVSLVTSSARSYADDEDFDFSPPLSSRRGKRISSHANEDFETVKGQSRRQDAALLNSISQRMSELGSGSSPSYYHGGGGGYRGHPVMEETVIRTTVPRTGSVHTVPRRAPVIGRGLRAGSLPPPSPRGARRGYPGRLARVDLDLEADFIPTTVVPDRPPPSVSGLRSRATEAKNKLDTHRSMLDRYLPIYLGPEAEVQDEVNYKYGELVQRIPRLEPYKPNPDRGSGLSSSASVPYRRSSLPPKPSTYDNALRRPPMKLRVSEPRRRAREVLCKTKGDPHYYDY